MLDFEAISPALEAIGRRLPDRGKVCSHAVGANNQLQGQAHYLDFGSHLLLLLLSGLDTSKPRYSCTVAERPCEEYSARSSSQLDHRMTICWADILEDKVEQFLHFKPRPNRGSTDSKAPPLPEAHYPVLSAAVTQRMRGWELEKLHLSSRIAPDLWGAIRWDKLRQWWPGLAPDLTEMSARNSTIDFSRLVLPWPLSTDVAGVDALEFYQRFPQAHGRISLGPPTFSADGSQAIVTLRHSLGFELSCWDLRRLPKPDGPRPGEFWEVLWLEKDGAEWRLSGHLRYDVESPPALLEARELGRLQAEIGDWGKVLKVVVDQSQAVEAEVQTPLGIRRVLSAPGFDLNRSEKEAPVVFEQPTLWIFSRQITGQAIMRALTREP